VRGSEKEEKRKEEMRETNGKGKEQAPGTTKYKFGIDEKGQIQPWADLRSAAWMVLQTRAAGDRRITGPKKLRKGFTLTGWRGLFKRQENM
jgi:hypothetical protein